jgi:Flp pilus assembly pilin Flp
MFVQLRRLAADDRGADMIEYGLIAAIISIAALVALMAISPIIGQLWDQVAAAMQQV